MSQSLFRIQKDKSHPYVILNKQFFDNKLLSLEAKGFLGFVMCKPDDWHFHVKELARSLGYGVKKILKIIRECIDQGYCFRYQDFEGSKFATVHTVFFESREECDQFKIIFPQRQLRQRGNAPTTNINSDPYKETYKEKVPIEKKTSIPASCKQKQSLFSSPTAVNSDVALKVKELEEFDKLVEDVKKVALNVRSSRLFTLCKRHSIALVKPALKYMYLCINEGQIIDSHEAWLTKCLKQEWYLPHANKTSPGHGT
jgi:hypothetical protein